MGEERQNAPPAGAGEDAPFGEGAAGGFPRLKPRPAAGLSSATPSPVTPSESEGSGVGRLGFRCGDGNVGAARPIHPVARRRE